MNDWVQYQTVRHSDRYDDDVMNVYTMQVTNQMIIACKSHISNGGRDTVWTLPIESVFNKLNNCLRLYEAYLTTYHATKRQLEQQTDERKFDFSETLIFGKFEKLSRRLSNITAVFNAITLYSSLRDFKIDCK